MANKLAGQRAKFSKARSNFFSSSDQAQCSRAAQLMAEVLVDAPDHGFSERDVTQGEDVPDAARRLAVNMPKREASLEEDPDELVAELQTTVEAGDVQDIGEGEEFVYAYGYRCAPDRLKIGRCTGDVTARIAAQISTGTPDRPVLLLRIRTHDCNALERTLHGMFRLNGRKVAGSGAEWFLATCEEVVAAYKRALDGW